MTPQPFSSTFQILTWTQAEYWPMAREYGIWNATIASLQFWAEDLDLVTLGDTSECIYQPLLLDPNQPHLMPAA